MKRIVVFISAILLFVCTSCIEEKNYKMTEFFLKNACDQTIKVTSSALVRYYDGYEEVTLVDYVSRGEILSMRRLEVTDNFSMSDVFTNIEIQKGIELSTFDAMNRDNWVKTLTSDSKDGYTLTVDESFFK